MQYTKRYAQFTLAPESKSTLSTRWTVEKVEHCEFDCVASVHCALYVIHVVGWLVGLTAHTKQNLVIHTLMLVTLPKLEALGERKPRPRQAI